MRHRRQKPWHGLDQHEFSTLATYNAECARGIVHTSQWRAQMQALQTKYDQALNQARQR